MHGGDLLFFSYSQRSELVVVFYASFDQPGTFIGAFRAIPDTKGVVKAFSNRAWISMRLQEIHPEHFCSDTKIGRGHIRHTRAFSPIVS